MTRTLLFLVLGWCCTGLSAAEPTADMAKGLYFPCQSCHGEQGEGSAAIHSPALAGQDAGYLARQLRHFRDGLRGGKTNDRYGKQMALMAANLNDDTQIELLANTISQFESWNNAFPPAVVSDKGEKLYSSCIVCHGAQGGGNSALSAPRVAGLDSLYLATQLRHFRDGLRAYSPKDSAGQQMRAAMSMLRSDDDIEAVSIYISSLNGNTN